jgi:hypothetical protein
MIRTGNLKEIFIFCVIILQEQKLHMWIRAILQHLMRTQIFRIMYKDAAPAAVLI